MKKYLGLALISLFLLKSTPANAQNNQPEIKKSQLKALPLPGKLNDIMFFNSNSPEMVTTEGILLSSFPPDNKKYPSAHLNYLFQGRFDIFTHHITPKTNITMLHQAIIIKNPGDKAVNLEVISSSSYLTSESPFLKFPDLEKNNYGKVFSGPGDRASQDILRDKNMDSFGNKRIIIPPGQTVVFADFPVKNGNERTSQFRLKSDGPLYIADLAAFEKGFLWWAKKPELKDWLDILNNHNLAEKRDFTPSPREKKLAEGERFIYGRVSGISSGTEWNSLITNKDEKFFINPGNQSYAFALNTMTNNTLGTNQIQTADLIKRYPDTALYTNGNYGLTYNISIPFYNNTGLPRDIVLSFDTPVRIPENSQENEISYYTKAPEKIAFRGELKLEYKSYLGLDKEKYFHIIQRFGQKGGELLRLTIDPGEYKPVNISFVYPADATAPHILTINIEKNNYYK